MPKPKDPRAEELKRIRQILEKILQELEILNGVPR
jgi:hypothetical protein